MLGKAFGKMLAPTRTCLRGGTLFSRTIHQSPSTLHSSSTHSCSCGVIWKACTAARATRQCNIPEDQKYVDETRMYSTSCFVTKFATFNDELPITTLALSSKQTHVQSHGPTLSRQVSPRTAHGQPHIPQNDYPPPSAQFAETPVRNQCFAVLHLSVRHITFCNQSRKIFMSSPTVAEAKGLLHSKPRFWCSSCIYDSERRIIWMFYRNLMMGFVFL